MTTPGVAPAALGLRHELARKSIHLTSAAAPVAYALGLPADVVLVALTALAGVALAVETARHRSAAAREMFVRVCGRLLRVHETDRLSGATWMLLAFALAAALFSRPVAVTAMLGVSLGDAAAAVVGRWWGTRHPAAVGRKTFAGTFACFLATAAGALWVAGLPLPVAALLAAAAATAERVALPLDDNLRIVLAVGAAAVLASAAAPTLLGDAWRFA